MPTKPPLSGAEPLSPEPLLAGTLALLTFFGLHPTLAATQKIASNLQALQDHPGVSNELATVCRRLATHWQTLGCDLPPRPHAASALMPGTKTLQ